MTDSTISFRDKLASELLVVAFARAQNLGDYTKEERQQLFTFVSTIIYEAVDILIEVGKDQSNEQQ